MGVTGIIELETLKDKNKNLQSSNKSAKGQEHHITELEVVTFIRAQSIRWEIPKNLYSMNSICDTFLSTIFFLEMYNQGRVLALTKNMLTQK